MTSDDVDGETAYRRAVLRLGAVCGLLGGVGFVIAGALHGDLPGQAEAALGYVAPRSEWTAVHLAAIVSALLWVPAFAGLAHAVTGVAGRILGRLAVGSAVIGVAVFIVDYSVDGYVLKFLADEWAAARGSDQQAKVQAAEAVLGVVRGTVRASLTWLFGLPFLLAGLAVAVDRSHARWFGWIAVVTGGGTVLAGLATYARGRAEDPFFLTGILLSFVSFVWLIALAVLLWRRAASTEAKSRPSAA